MSYRAPRSHRASPHRYSLSYLTAGCWSPTRPGVFYTARMDGVVDIWDYYYRQNAVALSHKVGDQALSSIAVQGSTQSGGGRLVAVGDVNGNVSLLEVCESLAVPQSNEKGAIGAMFERESKREKARARCTPLSRRTCAHTWSAHMRQSFVRAYFCVPFVLDYLGVGALMCGGDGSFGNVFFCSPVHRTLRSAPSSFRAARR